MVDASRILSLATGRRFVVTVAFVAVTGVLVTYVVPRIGAAISRRIDALLEDRSIQEPVLELWSHTPPGISLHSFVRLAQGLLAFFALLFVLGLWGWAETVHTAMHLLVDSLPSLSSLALTALVLAGVYSGSHYVGDWVSGVGEEATYIEDHTTEILTRSLQLVLLLGGGLTILSIWNVDIDNLLLGAGVLSVLIGFAARSTFSSVISGFVLMFSRPFEVGDWVELADTEGQVTDVTIVNTRLRTSEGERIVLPNDAIGDSEIVNYSHESKLCVPFEVGVAYGTDLDRATELIEETLSDVELFSSGSAVEVFPQRFGDSSIVLEVRFWIDRPHPLTRRRARAQAIESIKDAFDREGIEIPFPQRTVSPRETGNPIAE